MVDLIVILLVGGIIGWVASSVMRTNPQRDALLNVVVGIAGALLGGILLAPLVWGASITRGALDVRSLVISFLGAALLLAVVNFIRRGLKH